MLNPEILTQGLNPAQADAVKTLDGPLLILAGAGSGKTRVLTHRMASLIANGKAAPDDILCVTFTNKAASEMEHRIYKILSDLGIPVGGEMWISTFHSFCVRVLRRHIELLDYKKPFTIYDSGDQLSQIKRVLTAVGLNDKMYPPKSFQSRISNAKMMGLSPDAFSRAKKGFLDDKTLKVYTQYEAEMKKANALDFDDLLMKTYELFQMYPDILSQYQQKFRYIMVDEYQDTNHIQYLLMQLLSKAHRNFCVVGDAIRVTNRVHYQFSPYLRLAISIKVRDFSRFVKFINFLLQFLKLELINQFNQVIGIIISFDNQFTTRIF